MARSDGHGARSGHPVPPRLGEPFDLPVAPHHGHPHEEQDWPEPPAYGAQYPQEPYWQPHEPAGYEPAAPSYPSSIAPGQPLEPMAPDRQYASRHSDYAADQNAYHYPHEPGFDPYEHPSHPHLQAPGEGNAVPGLGARDYSPFQEPATNGYAQTQGYQQHDHYAPQYGQSYQPTREPSLDHYAPRPPESGPGQFEDYLTSMPSLDGESRIPARPDLNSRPQFDSDRSALRGADFEDWPRLDSSRRHGPSGYEQPSPYAPTAAAHGGYAEPGWAQEGRNIPLDSGPIFASAGYDTAQGLALNSDEYEDDEYEDDEPVERSRGARIGWILMALVGAVAVGGGFAYGYKVLLGPAATQVADTPVVKSTSEPPKIRPQDPGGRTFDHTNSKILGRLSEQRSASNTETLADDGSRRVSTVVIGRNGDIIAPQTASTPSTPPPANPVVSVPGLTLVDGFGGRPTVTPTATVSPQRPIIVQPPAADDPSPDKPAVVARTEPVAKEPDSPRTPPPAAKPAEKAERVTASTAALTAPKTSAPVTTASTTAPAAESAGYVAVLASVPVSATSRMDALAQYADIQQNYSSVLASRTPDVREADLGSRGRYHRLMVGPPGSKESAAALCAQLKAAGYSGCWITTY